VAAADKPDVISLPVPTEIDQQRQHSRPLLAG